MDRAHPRFRNDDINNLFLHLQRSLVRGVRIAKLGGESAKLTLKLSSPYKTRYAVSVMAAYRERVAHLDQEQARLIQEDRDDEHPTAASVRQGDGGEEAPAKRHKQTGPLDSLPVENESEAADLQAGSPTSRPPTMTFGLPSCFPSPTTYAASMVPEKSGLISTSGSSTSKTKRSLAL